MKDAFSSIITLLRVALDSLAKGSLPEPEIMKQLLSEGLGMGIVAGSFLVKLPQIVNVVKARSAEGLNPMSFEVETFCALVAATYGFAHHLSFNAFGESAAICVQNIILLLYIYMYQKCSPIRRAAMLSGLIVWGTAAYMEILTAAHLSALFDLNSFILFFSRIPQIIQNQQNKNTGQLSLLTYGLQFGGTLARIFTTMQEKNAGPAMMRGVLLSCAMNGVVFAQIVMYGGKSKAASKGKKKRA